MRFCTMLLMKGEKGESAFGKAAFSKAFHEVVTLTIGFFPRAKPFSSSSSEELIPWEDSVVLLPTVILGLLVTL